MFKARNFEWLYLLNDFPQFLNLTGLLSWYNLLLRHILLNFEQQTWIFWILRSRKQQKVSSRFLVYLSKANLEGQNLIFTEIAESFFLMLKFFAIHILFSWPKKLFSNSITNTVTLVFLNALIILSFRSSSRHVTPSFGIQLCSRCSVLRTDR